MSRVHEFANDLQALEEFYIFNLPELDSSLNRLNEHKSLRTLRIHCYHLVQNELEDDWHSVKGFDFCSEDYEGSVELKSLSIEEVTEDGWVSFANLKLCLLTNQPYPVYRCQAKH